MRTPLLILAVAVALVAVSHLARRPQGEPAPPRPTVAGPPVVLATPDQAAGPAPGDETHRRLTGTPPAASRAARAFLTAYLRWETGSTDPAVAAAVRRLAAPSLWHELQQGRGQPTAPERMSPARLTALVPGTHADRHAAAVLATLRRDHHASGLAVVLHRDDGAWRVAGIGP